MPKLVRSAFLLLILVGLLSSLQAQDGGVLRVGLRDLVEIDPALGAQDDEIFFNHLIYDYLVEIQANGSLAPSLSESWEVTPDGLTYTFKLRSGVMFHDGSAFTAEDVVFTFNRLVEVGSSIVGLLGEFEVQAAGDDTVVFTLPAPNADFVFGVASRFSFILNSDTANINQLGEGDTALAGFNGTGPFMLTDLRVGEGATLAKNPNYWMSGAPALDGVELVFFRDEQARVDALRSGTVDFIFRIPDDLLPTLEGASGITVTEKATNIHPVIRLRTDDGSIGEDVRVRQAFKYATDRELLNLDVLDGKGFVGNNDPIGPVYGAFYHRMPNQAFEPERACELLAAVHADGADNGFIQIVDGQPRLEVDFNVINLFTFPKLAEFIQQQWEEGCIYVNLNVLPGEVYYGGGENDWLNSQLGLTDWGTRAVPQEYLSVAYTTGAPYNETQWSNPQLDELATQAAQTANIQERAAIYEQISRIFLEEGPIIIAYFMPVAGAYRDGVQGLDMHPFPGQTDMRSVSVSG